MFDYVKPIDLDNYMHWLWIFLDSRKVFPQSSSHYFSFRFSGQNIWIPKLNQNYDPWPEALVQMKQKLTTSNKYHNPFPILAQPLSETKLCMKFSQRL